MGPPPHTALDVARNPSPPRSRPARRGPPRRNRTLAILAAISWTLAGLPRGPSAADLAWTDEDWSDGNYAWTSSIDPEVHPGLLVLEDAPQRMRFAAEVTPLRGVYALAVYHDTLFIGACDYPITTWAADVLTYDYRTDDFALSYQPDEQGITSMKVFGDTLYLPGPETENGYLGGCAIYLYNGAAWIKKQTAELALHLFDLEVLNRHLYVTTGDRDWVGSVRVSHDWGDSFENILQLAYNATNARRFYGIGSFQDRIYAQPDGYEPEGAHVYAYDGASWDTIPVPGLPTGKMGTFTTWGDSLLLTVHNRMFILHDEQVHGSWLPFSGDRWCRGFHVHKGVLYGGADHGDLYRWQPGSAWTHVCQLGLDPQSEEISALATYYGRLYVATARYEGHNGGRLYVSAALPYGSLASSIHDFGTATDGGVLTWEDFRPGAGNLSRFQVRSGSTVPELGAAPFVGPDGTSETHYLEPGNPLPAVHHGHRYFQYRVELACPEELEMPFVESVTLEVDSLDTSWIATRPRAESAPPGPRLIVRPNPASREVHLHLELPGDPAPLQNRIRLRVSDVQGRTVRTAILPPTARSWPWNLCRDDGAPVAAGIYWVQASRDRDQGRATTGTVLVLR